MSKPIEFEFQNKKYSIEIINKKRLPGSSSPQNNDKRSMLIKKTKKDEKKALRTASNISLHSSFKNDEYEIYNYAWSYLLNLCVIRKNYKNFVALVNPKIPGGYSDWSFPFKIPEFTADKPLGIYLDGEKLYYLGEEKPTYFLKLLRTLEKREERFIIILLVCSEETAREAHANIIILDSLKKNGYYFEPHGIKLYFLNKSNQVLIRKLFESAGYTFFFPEQYYYTPGGKFDTFGFQNLEVQHSITYGSAKGLVLDAIGYCYYWCMYFINMIMKYPNIAIDLLFKKLYQKLLTLKKRDFRSHIRTYAQRHEKAIKKLYPDCANKMNPKSPKEYYNCRGFMFLEYYKVFDYKHW